jgi:hypothetical protein
MIWISYQYKFFLFFLLLSNSLLKMLGFTRARFRLPLSSRLPGPPDPHPLQPNPTSTLPASAYLPSPFPISLIRPPLPRALSTSTLHPSSNPSSNKFIGPVRILFNLPRTFQLKQPYPLALPNSLHAGIGSSSKGGAGGL